MKQSFFLLTLLIFSFTAQAQHEDYWEPYAEGVLPEEYGVFSVSVVDENVIWAVAYDQTIDNLIPSDHVVKILKTVNGGDIWQVFDLAGFPGRISFDIQATGEQTAWMTLHDYDRTGGFGPMVIKTSDGGLNWDITFNGKAAGVWVRFFNEQEGFIGNFPDVAYTEDGGNTWTTDSLENFRMNEGVLIGSGNNSCSVVGDNVWVGTAGGRVGHSSDKGKTWEFYDTGLGRNTQIISVAFKDEMNGMILGNSIFTRFSKTTDGGKTWTTLGAPGFSFAHNLEYVPGTDGTFVACTKMGRPNPISSFTEDFGETWNQVTKGFPFGGVDFSGVNIGWAGIGWIENATTPALLKWTGNIFTNTKKISEPTLLEVFPNPAEEVINIQLPEGIQPFSMKIFNVVGREERSIPYSELSGTIDVSDLPKGVYFMKAVDNEVNFVASFVKN